MLLNTPHYDANFIAPDFRLKNIDQNDISLYEYTQNKAFIIAFICNHCPYVKAIIQRFVEDTQKLKNHNIETLAIMPNNYHYVPEDSPENMKKFSLSHEFSFPYLLDDTQDVAKKYGAVCTPDFFGFDDKKQLRYRGRLDDVRMNGDPQKRTPELLNAMTQIATHQSPPETQYPSMGCSIKWK